MNKKSENEIIKEAVKEFRSQGIDIIANWNAGGDECICSVEIDGNDDLTYQSIPICEKLVEIVIEQLQLPDAGEVYHNGSGVIEFDEQEGVYICFSAKFGYYDYDGGYYIDEDGDYQEINQKLEDIIYTQVMEDPLGLRNLLHKANVNFEGRINRNQEIEALLQMQVTQGDDIQFSDEETSFYTSHIKKLLLYGLKEMEANEKPHKKGKDYSLFQSINLVGSLTTQPEVIFKLSPSFEYFENYHEEIVTLIT